MDILNKYAYILSEEEIAESLEKVEGTLDSLASPRVYKQCFSLMDLTTLHTNDTEASVVKLVSKANSIIKEFPGYPLPASVCVYPNFAETVASSRESSDLHVTVVSACFPSSQSFLEVKLKECEMAVEAGADEVDIVLALNAFLAGDYDSARREICSVREIVDAVAARQGRRVTLKVILETGLLKTAENIAAASFLAMESGADFIKTSTGKVDINATPRAAWIMCGCIRRYYECTGKKIGFKAAGGISTAKDALNYYAVVQTALGEEWLCKDLFRFGVSRLGNALMSAIEGKAVNFF